MTGSLVGRVARGDVAAGAQRNAHRRGVAVADDADERERELAALVGDALGPRAPGAVAPERQRVGDAGALDAGDLLDPAQHLVEVGVPLLARRVPAVGIDADRRRARRLEAHVDVEHADQAANQQARADQQHAGERDLRDDQRVAHPRAPPALGRAARRVLQRVVQRRAAQPEAPAPARRRCRSAIAIASVKPSAVASVLHARAAAEC